MASRKQPRRKKVFRDSRGRFISKETYQSLPPSGRKVTLDYRQRNKDGTFKRRPVQTGKAAERKGTRGKRKTVASAGLKGYSRESVEVFTTAGTRHITYRVPLTGNPDLDDGNLWDRFTDRLLQENRNRFIHFVILGTDSDGEEVDYATRLRDLKEASFLKIEDDITTIVIQYDIQIVIDVFAIVIEDART